MKGLSGLLFLLGVSVTANGLTEESIVPHATIALGCFLGSLLLWKVARRRDRSKLVALRNFHPRRERR